MGISRKFGRVNRDGTEGDGAWLVSRSSRRIQDAVASWICRRYLARTDRLTIDRAAKTKEALGPATGYVGRLAARLVKVGLDVRHPNSIQLATATTPRIPGREPRL
jgi:adenosylmethionine-8-amino-7-oxononanoate aminotransferase